MRLPWRNELFKIEYCIQSKQEYWQLARKRIDSLTFWLTATGYSLADSAASISANTLTAIRWQFNAAGTPQ